MSKEAQTESSIPLQTLILGAGCFWCSENIFLRLIGVVSVMSGYANGDTDKPTYEQVCSGTTNHAEVIKITFDNSLISLDTILTVFFAIHDPTTLNRQGDDIGSQYRSTILFTTEAQHNVALEKITQLETKKTFAQSIVTIVEAVNNFYSAENYHQNYYNNNNTNQYCQIVVAKKIQKFIIAFPHLLKEQH